MNEVTSRGAARALDRLARARLAVIVAVAVASAFVACGTHDFSVAPDGGGGEGGSPDGGGVDDGSTLDVAPGDDGGPGGDGGNDGSIEPYFQAVLDDAPIAYWSFDSATGTVVDDRTGHGHAAHLTDGGAALVALSPIANGKALHLDGGYALVDPADAAAFDLKDSLAFSIEAWVDPDVVQPGPFQRVVSRDGANGALYHDGYDLHVTTADAGGAGFVRWNGDDPPVEIAAGGSAPIGTFTHLVGTYDGAKVRLYVNGQKVSETASPSSIFRVDKPLTLGARADDLAVKFSGAIDEVAIYDHALTEARVAVHFHASGR